MYVTVPRLCLELCPQGVHLQLGIPPPQLPQPTGLTVQVEVQVEVAWDVLHALGEGHVSSCVLASFMASSYLFIAYLTRYFIENA